LIGAAVLLGFLVALGLEAWRARSRMDAWSLWAMIPATLVFPILAYSQIEGRLIQEPYLWVALGLLYSARLRQEMAVGQADRGGSRSLERGRIEIA